MLTKLRNYNNIELLFIKILTFYKNKELKICFITSSQAVHKTSGCGC
jgi:hypothetical protein